MEDFKKKNGLLGDIAGWVIALDEDQHITADIFHANMFPETITIPHDIRMARKIAGDRDWNAQETTHLIDQILGSAPAATS